MQKKKPQIKARTSKTLSFKERVFEVVAKIPKGGTLTYKEVSQLAGSPKAFRAVGNILKTNYDSKIPCHRVVRSDGAPGGYNRGVEAKLKKLKGESRTIQHTGKR